MQCILQWAVAEEKSLFFIFLFEESPDQLIRNMALIGINLKPQIQSKLLFIHASRPSLQGLEMHLLVLHKLMVKLKPHTVIIDPISSLITIGSKSEVSGMLVRLMDTLKINNINALFTSLTHQNTNEFDDATVDAVSSLADTWVNVRNENTNNLRVRSLLIIKARGMGHFNHQQDFIINNKGVQFLNPEKNNKL